MKIFKLGELFCGPGGIGYGAKLASSNGFKIIHEWATDYDKDTCDTYKKNILSNGTNGIICEDIRKLDIKMLPKINALAFGFPCNDFSVVGKQKGMNGSYGPLYSYGVKILRHFQPDFFIAENVGGLRNADEGVTLQIILEELEKSNYYITPHYYKFEQYGIPQTRHRIIIVGIRKDLNIFFKVPAPTHEKFVTCKDAITNPPISKDAFNHDLTKQTQKVIERLKFIKPGENAFNANIPENLKLNINGATLSIIYRRLDPQKPSYTITGSGGGGTHVYHWKENRALTNRERARLQTFPDDFIFVGSKESVRKQIGMAVPPRISKIIFESIFKSFAGIKYDSVNFNINPQPILI